MRMFEDWANPHPFIPERSRLSDKFPSPISSIPSSSFPKHDTTVIAISYKNIVQQIIVFNFIYKTTIQAFHLLRLAEA